MTRKICVVSTSRADFGLLYWLLQELRQDRDVELQLVVTGMHLAPEFGATVREVEAEFPIARRVEMLLSGDSEAAAIKSVGVGLVSFADVLTELAPAVVVLTGDRFELLAVGIAAFMLRIPIAHIHGGETTQGAQDEGVRHALTKLASVHFTTTEAYARRVVQLGEHPSRVHAVGAPGLDAIRRVPLMDRAALAAFLGFDLAGTVAIVTFHPVTLEAGTARVQAEAVCEALRQSGVRAVFTKANADAGGRAINAAIEAFAAREPDRFRVFDSLGQRAYLSCLKNLDLMVGNSSSGLIEGPSFGIPVVNIGDRQRGRIRTPNVIDAEPSVEAIRRAIEQATSPAFRGAAKAVVNPYDPFADGNTCVRMKNILKTMPLDDGTLKKAFFDVPLPGDLFARRPVA